MASLEDLAALRRKYVEIVRLRRAAEADPGEDPRRAMAALASEFPGALREADALPMSELERRVAAIHRVESGLEPPSPWMNAMVRFHALARGALAAKRWLQGKKQVDAELRAAFEGEVDGLSYAGDAKAWIVDLSRLASPPRGRVTELVFERVAKELDLSVSETRGWIFGTGDSEVD